jgi:hypothetical protein
MEQSHLERNEGDYHDFSFPCSWLTDPCSMECVLVSDFPGPDCTMHQSLPRSPPPSILVTATLSPLRRAEVWHGAVVDGSV